MWNHLTLSCLSRAQTGGPSHVRIFDQEYTLPKGQKIFLGREFFEVTNQRLSALEAALQLHDRSIEVTALPGSHVWVKSAKDAAASSLVCGQSVKLLPGAKVVVGGADGPSVDVVIPGDEWHYLNWAEGGLLAAQVRLERAGVDPARVPFSEPAVYCDFARRILSATHQWNELTSDDFGVGKIGSASGEAIRDFFSAMESAGLKELAYGPEETVLENLSTRLDLKAKAQRAFKLHRQKEEAKRAYDSARDDRVNALQKAAEASGIFEFIPPIAFSPTMSRMGLAEADPAKGQVLLGKLTQYPAVRGAKIAGMCLHELTHIEQLVLILRKLADDLDIGVSVEAEELNRLARAYADAIALPLWKLLDETAQGFLKSLVAFRNGIRLSKDASERAARLQQAFHSALGAPYVQREAWLDAMAVDCALRPYLSGLESDDYSVKLEACEKLRRELLSDDKKQLQLFGANLPDTVASVLESVHAGNELDDSLLATHIDLLARVLRQRLQDCNLVAQDKFSLYMGAHELEAYYVGLLTELHAPGNDVTSHSNDLVVQGAR
jgi:hypothetical protein